jgi:hypothetical protein
MANVPVAAQPSTMTSFHPNNTVVNPHGATHGSKTTMNLQRFVTPVKLEFDVPSLQDAFNLTKAHQVILQLLKDKDPALEIIPSKTGKAKFTHLAKFPANKMCITKCLNTPSTTNLPKPAKSLLNIH